MRRSLAVLSFVLAAAVSHAPAQTPQPITQDTAPVLMLSDIHFDPFHDPAKLPALMKAPVAEWHHILSQPDSPTQAETFADVQAACKAKGIDTPMPLLASALAAAHAQQPHPLFVTVSGDLTVHKLECLYQKFYPAKTKDTYAADYSAFSAKIVAFVALELRHTFPGVPVYLALGNNDSGCKDYEEDPDSAYLRADAKAFAEDAVSPANRDAILREFSQYGDYNIELPAPFHHTRLIVLQDIFSSERYTNCSGSAGDVGTYAAAKSGLLQMEWLQRQLTAAKEHHEHVWVMAHIPPGVDAYSTFTKTAKSKSSNGCRYAIPAPVEFLNGDEFGNFISNFPDVINLVLLGHTHMDEMRSYTGKDGSAIPGKLVPSVTPVNGNTPSFTLGVVDPARAILVDYTVYAEHVTAGVGTQWLPEYTYSTTYHQPDFSGASVAAITRGFLADPTGKTPESQSYETFYFVGGPSAGLNLKAAALSTVWPVYACSITQPNAVGFSACACPAQP